MESGVCLFRLCAHYAVEDLPLVGAFGGHGLGDAVGGGGKCSGKGCLLDVVSLFINTNVIVVGLVGTGDNDDKGVKVVLDEGDASSNGPAVGWTGGGVIYLDVGDPPLREAMATLVPPAGVSRKTTGVPPWWVGS